MRSEVTLSPCKLLDLKHIPDLTVSSKLTEIVFPNSNGNAGTILERTQEKKIGLYRYIGIIFALLTSLVFSCITLLVKGLSGRYHVFNVGFWRYITGLIPTLILISYQYRKTNQATKLFNSIWPLSQPGSKKNLALIIYRSIMTCTGVLFEFFALNYISIADLSVIGYCTPIGVAFLAYFLLKEALSVIQVGASIIALIGVLIISRPPFLTGADGFDTDHLLGIGIAGGCMLLRVTVLICLRYLRGTHYLLIQLALGIWGVGQALVMSLSVGRLQLPATTEDYALAFTLGMAGFLGQTLFTLALKYETSGVVAMVRCADVIFAFILQFIFLGIVPDLFSCIGALLVLLSMGIVGIRKALMELSPEHPIRVRLKYLLK